MGNISISLDGFHRAGWQPSTVARQTPVDFYNATKWTACNAATAAGFSAVVNAAGLPVSTFRLTIAP